MISKTNFILLFIFGFVGISFCQTDTSNVSFVAYWSKGEQHKFRVSKIKKQWKGDEITKNDTILYDVKFEVLDSTATSYKIKWSYENDLTNIYNLPPEILEKFAKYQFTEVIYSTTEMGEFVGIENWEAIGKMMKDLFTDLAQYQELEKKLNANELQKAMDSFISVYSSKQGVEQLVFKELQTFHFPFGVAFSFKEPIEYEEELPKYVWR
ncbi:MAG: hypothetical protein IPP71_07650 [Bacteroidetes bacterium]|nr:hypothetical protein [Bacteroidota bacterium]